jgi:hypothetical protein
MRKLVSEGILCDASGEGPAGDPIPFIIPTRAWVHEASCRVRLPLVLWAIWHQISIASALKRRGFHKVIGDLEGGTTNIARVDDVPTHVARILAAFARAELVISRADNCLVRSLALHRMLRGAGAESVLVIGVTASPFSAHAWVQRGSVVLNDSLDQVRIFSPILIV